MHSVRQLIEMALQEDIGPGDITTENLVKPEYMGQGIVIAKESFVIAGLEVARQVFEYLDPKSLFSASHQDGDRVDIGGEILKIEGQLQALLKGERTALNFLQHLSGIATCVRSFVDTLQKRNVRLVDTRKTTPGLRVLEKYAVRVGGAHNHRMGLYDGVLIKDNHIAVCGGIRESVDKIRGQVHQLVKIEVEVSSLAEVEEALKAGADIIMLDNMPINQIREAVTMVNGNALIEVSGSITEDNLQSLADTGVDIISSGALTHSAKSVDMSMTITAVESTRLKA
jgi:nicotinate-nucleotide pyrophosphorylase (carboxylating)